MQVLVLGLRAVAMFGMYNPASAYECPQSSGISRLCSTVLETHPSFQNETRTKHVGDSMTSLTTSTSNQLRSSWNTSSYRRELSSSELPHTLHAFPPHQGPIDAESWRSSTSARKVFLTSMTVCWTTTLSVVRTSPSPSANHLSRRWAAPRPVSWIRMSGLVASQLPRRVSTRTFHPRPCVSSFLQIPIVRHRLPSTTSAHMPSATRTSGHTRREDRPSSHHPHTTNQATIGRYRLARPIQSRTLPLMVTIFKVVKYMS